MRFSSDKLKQHDMEEKIMRAYDADLNLKQSS